MRRELSPRHVPGVIDECPDIPITPNGKKVEVLIKQIVSGGRIQEDYSRSVTKQTVWTGIGLGRVLTRKIKTS